MLRRLWKQDRRSSGAARRAMQEAAGQTRVRWTLALEPRLLLRLGAPLAGRTISRLLQHAMENLAPYLARNGASERRATGR
jgi:hypothetical protein